MKKLIILSLACFLFGLPYWVFAQGIWTYYSDELPGIVINMAQDKWGNYWFATNNGVCELDTNGCWHYLADPTVWDTTMVFYKQIEIDHDNNKWFIGYIHYTYTSNQYAVKFDDSTFTYFNPSGAEGNTSINSLGIDAAGNIWAGSMANWAYWFDGTQWHPFYVPGTTIYDPIHTFCVDRKGTFYIGHNNGISSLDGYYWGYYRYSVNSFGVDKNNRLWFGTQGLGVYDGLTWKLYTTDDGLLTNVCIVAIDSSQNVWVSYAGYADGVSRFDGSNWEHLTKDDGLSDNKVGSIFVDKKGSIWFASLFVKGLSVYRDTTTTRIETQNGSDSMPEIFQLYQNYPNPFNSLTTLSYILSNKEWVKLVIYNLAGKEVIALVNEEQLAGEHQVIWDGTDKNGKEVSTGIYFAILKCGELMKYKKLILIR